MQKKLSLDRKVCMRLSRSIKQTILTTVTFALLVAGMLELMRTKGYRRLVYYTILDHSVSRVRMVCVCQAVSSHM